MSEQTKLISEYSSIVLVASMAVLGVVGLLIGSFVGFIVFSILGEILPVSPGGPSGQLVFSIGTYLGVAAVAVVYLLRYELPLSYVRFRSPSVVDLLLAVGTALVLLVLALAIPIFVGGLGLPFADHSITDSIAANPIVALVSIPISLLIVAPAEEFLYRGIIQTRLVEDFETNRAVAIAAFLFAFTHLLAYFDPGNVAGTLVTILVVLLPLGSILGAIYEYTENLFVPTLAHGLYNAITFGLAYVDVVGL